MVVRSSWLQLRKTIRNLRRKAARFYRRNVDLYLKDRSLRRVERFVFGWLTISVLIIGVVLYQTHQLSEYYLTAGSRPGGQFVEGIVGEIDSINPIFSGNRVSRTAEALLFRSLFTHDSNSEIVPDLARDYSVNEERTVYTVSLRPDIYWHDGKPVTAKDVAFTFRTIQNPDTDSSLQVVWQDIQIQAVDDKTVKFILPNPYEPFLTQLTTGIVPRHILEEVEPSRLRVANFNQSPVGSGPFVFDEIESGQRVHLTANPDYSKGKPQLDRFSVAVYPNEEHMVHAYNRGELSSMVASNELNTEAIQNQERTEIHRIDTTSQVFTFFNTNRIKDDRIRRALTHGLDQTQTVEKLSGNPDVVDSPLLPEHVGYISAQVPSNKNRAQQLLSEAGWERNDSDILQKNGETLSIELVTGNTLHYTAAVESVAEQWSELGVEVQVRTLDSSRLQQDFIRPRNYDALLFGVALGNDPDVYAYWHSSQTKDTGRNLSQYKSAVIDNSLEDGRTRANNKLRAAKYETFQKRWRTDAPAVALYRLHNYYVRRSEARSIDVDNTLHTIDRFHNVEDWTIKTQPVLRRLQE